jgi:CpeT/CpcT family (DUF1001)
MILPPELIALADYMSGEFENKAQAIADPAWFVHLRLWQKPVPLFQEDSITLFAEQANALYLDEPYRPRLMRIQAREDNKLQVQYYIPKDFTTVRGAGANPSRLQQFTSEQFELLPGCLLVVTWEQLSSNSYRFKAAIPPDMKCCFTYQGNTQQVNLGFEATPEEFLSYDKGIDINSGAAKWGAIMGAYRFHKK